MTPAAIRASAGALLHLPHARVANIARALERLQEAGFSVVGLDGRAPRTSYDEPCPEGRVAVVRGSEGEGMSRLMRERCDVLVALPDARAGRLAERVGVAGGGALRVRAAVADRPLSRTDVSGGRSPGLQSARSRRRRRHDGRRSRGVHPARGADAAPRAAAAAHRSSPAAGGMLITAGVLTLLAGLIIVLAGSDVLVDGKPVGEGATRLRCSRS